jgi:hypothetical protein
MADTRDEGAADTTRCYEVVVRGALDATLAATLPSRTIVSDDDLTRIDVTVADQAQLLAILRRLFAAGVELVSLNQRNAWNDRHPPGEGQAAARAPSPHIPSSQT